MKAKATLDQLQSAYQKTRSLKQVAAMFSMCPQGVHARLRAAGVNTTQHGLWTDSEIQKLRNWYANESCKNKLHLQALADLLKRNKSVVCKKAKELGLTNLRRRYDKTKAKVPMFKSADERRAALSEKMKEWHSKHDHPRGALGMRHDQKTKELIGRKSKERWHSMSKKQQEDQVTRAVASKIANNTQPRARVEATWKAGWREIGNQRIYARSRWEANIGRMLELRRASGDIAKWEHEPITFWFEKIKRGVRSYKPDFRITENDGSQSYIEVKGWMDARSKTTLSRMKRYHPNITIDVIESKRYSAIQRQLKSVIPEWELDARKCRQ